MSRWKLLELEDRAWIESYLLPHECEVADYSFTNFYLWHFSREIAACEIDNHLCIRTCYAGETPFLFMPFGAGNPKCVLRTLIEEWKANGHPFEMRSVSEQSRAELESLFPGKFIFTEQRERFDYVYATEELITLKGRKFHKKKNHFNRYAESYGLHYESIESHHADELITISQKWLVDLGERASEGMRNEQIGIEAVLKNWDSLGCRGGLLKVDNTVAAFSFGEMINQDTVVIHIEKADFSHHGAYQAINQQFLANEWAHTTYVNREEDLGIEGLRKAKLSYHPVRLVPKYLVHLKEDL